MKLLQYESISPTGNDFNFDATRFERVNLLVGDSGTGKTRFLNTIVNFFKQLTSNKVSFIGKWNVKFESDGKIYTYKLSVVQSVKSPREKTIEYEELATDTGAIFIRSDGKITWNNTEMPRLSSDQSCFSLLENDIITPIYINMKKIIARRFSGNELANNFQLGTIISNSPNNQVPPHIKKLGDLAVEPIDFHNKMYILQKMMPQGYNKVIALIKTAFPFIQDAGVQDIMKVLPNFQGALNTHIFCIRERNIEKWIATNDISSGMQKIFLLILDVFLLQDAGILLIDEYENSLGVSAINFLPDLIETISQNCQFIITSHHPYIINNIPIESWKVFHRDGVSVHITDGTILKEKYAKSRQDHFIQLINDPLYNGGID
jgi:predicted ATP-dependent endonuclease of OLD family